jgi:hypothetical protein
MYEMSPYQRSWNEDCRLYWPMCLILVLLTGSARADSPARPDWGSIEWRRLNSEQAEAALRRLSETWRANLQGLKTWRGSMSFQQEHIVSAKIIDEIVPHFREPEVIRELKGEGTFLIDMPRELLQSKCDSTERYYSTVDGRPVGDDSYPGAFGIILRPGEGHSLWHEPETNSNFLLGKADESLRLKPGIGAFRLDTYQLGQGQSFNGHTLDPRRALMLFQHPVDVVINSLCTAISKQQEVADVISVEVDSLEDAQYVKISWNDNNRRVAWWIVSMGAGGNVIESSVHHLQPSGDRAVEFEDMVADFAATDEVILPTRYLYTQIDDRGRTCFTRLNQVQTLGINDPVRDEDFTWAAFHPVPGQVVYDAIENRQFRFDEKLSLVEVDSTALGVRQPPERLPTVPPLIAFQGWLVFVNACAALVIGVWLVRGRLRHADRRQSPGEALRE